METTKVEELLEGLSDDDNAVYEAGTGDKERHIVIGRDRVIVVPDELKRIAVETDHNIETITFDCPRYWDDKDLSKMSIYINYLRADGDPGSHRATNVVVDETDPELMHFDWTIRGHVSAVAGSLVVLVLAKKTDSTGIERNRWNSEVNREMYVSEGLDTIPEAMTHMPDVVEQLLLQLNNAKDSALGDIDDKKTESLEEVADTKTEALSSIDTAKNSSVEEIVNTKTESLSAVSTAQTNAVNETNSAKTVALEEIGEAKTDAVNAVDTQTNLTNFVKSHFNLLRTGKVYTVRVPLWETSQTSNGEKLDDNAGLVMLPSTATEHRQDDYESIPLFKTYDCNAVVDEDGKRYITAMKGDANYRDTGAVDVFVLGMSYYEKYWIEDGYWYYSRTDTPREGYTLAVECKDIYGNDQGFALYGKHVAGLVDGIPYSSKNLIPARYCSGRTDGLSKGISYNGNIAIFKAKGNAHYSGGMMCDYKYAITSFYLKYAVIHSQSVMAGCTNFNVQFRTSIAETNTNRVVLTNSEAAKFPVGAYVSIGDGGSTTAPDRATFVCHNKAECVQILAKEVYDDTHTAVVVDALFDTTETTWITSFHWRSGFSDLIKGRDGCPCQNVSDLTSGIYPICIQGIELMVGGYEVVSNAILDIVDDGEYFDVYLTNDCSKLTANIDAIKQNYTKLTVRIKRPVGAGGWKYVTCIVIDIENGAIIITSYGENGSGSNSGFADAIYFDASTSGQKEILLLGNLWNAWYSGLVCLSASNGPSLTYWSILSRVSING